MAKNSNTPNFLARLWALSKLKLYIFIALAIVIAVVLAVIIHSLRTTEISTTVDERINATPSVVTSMREIGQWEFLAIDDEELIDTIRKGFFSDDALTRIYFGTLRLGIDLSKADSRWIEKKADTLCVTLPSITLLDTDFIDEARTQSYYESGKWSDADRAELYKRAKQKMLNRCLTPQNIRSAEENASRQIGQIFRSMGYKNVKVRIKPYHSPFNNGSNNEP